jgi:hypothetical protein
MDWPSGDQSTAHCPEAPATSMVEAIDRAFVPSADMIVTRRLPETRAITATRRPSGETAGGSESAPSRSLQTSVARPSSTFHSPSPVRRHRSSDAGGR